MILGDALAVMASLVERETLRGKIQTIYVDPPYGIKFGSNWQPTTSKRDVADGRIADLTREVEQVKAFRDTWQWGVNSYLTYLRDRLLVARELLTESGSLFVQIGDSNVHIVRSVLDEVFGAENFCAQIQFRTTSGATGELLAGTVDYLLWYAKDRGEVKYRKLYRVKELGGQAAGAYSLVQLPSGERRPMTSGERRDASQLPQNCRPYQLDNLMSQSPGRRKGDGAAAWFPVEFEGHIYHPNMQSTWKTNELGMERLRWARRLGVTINSLRYVRFIDDFPAFPITNFWDDTTTFGKDKIYVVQTNTKVIERCLLMTTDPGDLVLDPTCGSGTTAYVAEQWGRRWITIDTSRVALALARQRLMTAKYPFYLLADSRAGRLLEAQLGGQPPAAGPTGEDVRKGFVYERVPHITLRSIAHNLDLRAGMTREEIDAAIRRHAPIEPLYDRPHQDKKRIRVAGRFTVEGLSPHRVLAADADMVTGTERAADAAPASTYEQEIIDHLLREGVRNGTKNEHLEFDSLVPYADEWIQAEGHSASGPNGDLRVAVHIGGQYSSVGPREIQRAARAASRGVGFDLLVVCAFAYTPDAARTSEDFALGSLRVLLVRMNADLAIGQALLKKTGSDSLFTVFGEPDIEVREADDGRLVVEIRGVDVYNPATGQVRSAGTDRIAMWMIDTAYDEESFFVRHCYFTGGKDPYDALRRALRAEIDEAAWAECYRTVSRPFPRPPTGRIAVKVINHYGDEVLKAFPVGKPGSGR
jgi:adenine-specific DNA-methyltransferase